MVLVVVLFAGGQPFFAQSETKKIAKEKQSNYVKNMVDSKRYTIDVNRMIPMSGPTKALSSSYSLEIKGDSVVSYLPYMGEAYSVPYGGGKGLNFEAPITDYSINFDKKGTAKIKFKARTNEDNFSFYVQIYDNGSSSINITPINRQSISFHGKLDEEKEIK